VTRLQEVSFVLNHHGPDDEIYFLDSFDKKSCQSYKGYVLPHSLIISHISSANDNYNKALLHYSRLTIIGLSDLGYQQINKYNFSFLFNL
jgi:hypothetical protein